MDLEAPALRRRVLLAGLLLGVAAPARATGGPEDAFVNDALAVGGVALRTSLAARETSPNPAIQRFAASEIAEQRRIAARLGGPVPLGPRARAEIGALTSAPPGLPADRLYVAGQVAGHRQLLAVNESYARFGRDPGLAAVAAGAIPLIRTHLAILRDLRASLA